MEPRKIRRRRPRQHQFFRPDGNVSVRFNLEDLPGPLDNAVGVLIRVFSKTADGSFDRTICLREHKVAAGTAGGKDFEDTFSLGPGRAHSVTVLVWNRNAGNAPASVDEVEQRYLYPAPVPGTQLRRIEVFEESARRDDLP